MFRSVLFMAMMGLFPACGGGDSSSPDGGANEGEGEGDSPLPVGEGEGEGNGEGEGEGVRPLGADGEPCGGASKNECQDGYECLTCEEAGVDNLASEEPCEDRVCTCPQWFEGRWWAEFEPRAVDREFDFTLGRERERWSAHELEITQEGCAVHGPSEVTTILLGDGNINPSRAFWFLAHRGSVEGERRSIVFIGALSEDHRVITGTCEGEYPDGTVEPTIWFHITCTFSLTRR